MKRSKRLMDVTLAVLGIALLWPLMLIIAAIIRVVDGSPVLFAQERVGRDGRIFRMLKFRTLVRGSEKGTLMLTLAGDTRITRTGRWLRPTHLDELPQLFNVVVGDMTLVGPRPEVPCYVEHYTAEQRKSLTWVPGITDPATLQFADQDQTLADASDPVELYLRVIMPVRLRIAVDYAQRATLASDLAVLAATVRRIWRRS